MKAVIFKVLSKGLLILFLLALYGLYYYRGELFPQWFEPPVASASVNTATGGDAHSPANEQASTVKSTKADNGAQTKATVPMTAPQQESEVAIGTPTTAQAIASGTVGASEPVTAPAKDKYRDTVNPALSPAVTDEANPVVPQAAASSEHQPQASNAKDDDALVGFLPPGVQSPVAADQEKAVIVPAVPAPAPSVTGKADAVAGPAPMATADDMPAAAAAPITPAQPITIQMLLKQARDAYWDGDYIKARQAYQQVIALVDDDPAPYGELGNVYFAQKDFTAAAEAYTEAAYRLLAQGRVDEARHLMLVLKGLDEEKALELHRLIEQYQAQE